MSNPAGTLPNERRSKNALPGADDILREVLPNGIVVLARENFSSQSVVITGTLQVGTIFESLERAGLANMTAGLLMRGTQHRDFDNIHETLESIGEPGNRRGRAYR